MYKVFLSSTSRDLADYREAVHQAIDNLDGFHLIRMENFGARDTNATGIDTQKLEEADLLIGLIGHCYGSTRPGERISYTEEEYNLATQRELPRLMFVAPADFPLPAGLIEPDAKRERQRAFRDRVIKERKFGSFASPEHLASAVTAALANWRKKREGKPEPVVAAPVSPGEPGPNPYRGLEAFRKEDAAGFFGREALVDQLWNRFLELHAARADGEAPTRLLAILGASGSGKSSVAQAGLLAALEERPLPGRPLPIDVVLTPEARPLESLAVALARQVTGEASPAKMALELDEVLRTRAGHDGLRYLAERMLDVGGAGLILLVDQFEEIYSLCDDEQERAAFIGNLLHAARAPRGRVSIILTLRSDFLGAVNQHPELSRLIARQNVLVPVMGEEEIRRAIAEPAKRAGREIDQSTVDLLIDQTVGREGALPLLEFVLTRIWDGFRTGVSAADSLRQLGGVGGALAAEAQNVFDSLPMTDRAIARRAFLAMVHLGEGARDTRRRASLSEMVARGESLDTILRVLRRFAEPECRLVTLAAADGTTSAEVVHEALFDHWRLLQDWLDAGRDTVRFKRRLASAAKEWHSLGKLDGLLWRSPLLDQLAQYHARNSGQMTDLEIEFLESCLLLRDKSERRETELQATQVSLKYRIAAAIVALQILFLGTVLGITLRHSVQTVREQIARSEGVTLQLLADLSRAALRSDEFADLQTFIEGATRDPRVITVVVGAADGRVVAATEPELIGKPFPELVVAREHRYWRKTEIRGHASVLGTMAIKFSNQPLMLAYQETRNLGVSIAIVGMVAIAVVGAVVGFILTRRLAKLAVGADRAGLRQAAERQRAKD
jgi:Domain of unknown function (DUF4062)